MIQESSLPKGFWVNLTHKSFFGVFTPKIYGSAQGFYLELLFALQKTFKGHSFFLILGCEEPLRLFFLNWLCRPF